MNVLFATMILLTMWLIVKYWNANRSPSSSNRRINGITLIAGILAAAIGLQATAAQAECLTFTSGEILCDDGYYAYYYWSPTAMQWQVLDREATAAALGLGPESGSSDGESRKSSKFYPGGSVTTDGGCTMVSSGDLSFSSGC